MTNVKIVSSLEKIFPQSDGNFYEVKALSMLIGERLGFQLAVNTDEPLRFTLSGDEDVKISSCNIGFVPSKKPFYDDHDDDITESPDGYYPDVLYPTQNGEVEFVNGGWCSVWFEVESEKAGVNNIVITLFNEDNDEVAKAEIEIKVINAVLPEQELIHTNWFHCDCLATWYGVDAFSEEHWQIIENYMRVGNAHGLNMILTPLFTPPLDTAVGGERPTMQLVDVTVTDKDNYSFGFDKLTRWFDTATRSGMKWFELSHLFTQWGAKHAPKIVDINGKQLFGWKTRAGGKAYASFLEQFAVALNSYLESNGMKEKCWLHVSDEPNDMQVRPYGKASRLVSKLFPDYKTLDALSDFKFYKKGLVKTPVPALDHAHNFYGKVDGMWTYYCCGQYKGTSNRFMAMPSYRNRVLGLQLYKFRCVGFLQWGFNFWYSQYSKRHINPFEETDAGEAFPSGDAFVVYPGEDGQPLVSLRYKVFYDAFQDLSALRLLESKIGYDETLKLIENRTGEPLGFTNYERGIEAMLSKREAVNKAIEENI